LTKVLADDLGNDQVVFLVDFMRTAPNGKFTRRGKRIEITGLTRKKVKILIRKFLHTNHLTHHRVIDTGGVFEIVRVKPEPKLMERPKALKHPVPYGPPIPYLSGVVKPILRVEWQGKPPMKKGALRGDTRTAQ
jgi:hypothetical protein